MYRRHGESLADSIVVECDQFVSGSIIVWSAINYSFHSRLLIINGSLIARPYIDEILQPELVPLYRRQCNRMMFQQDNTRPHTARLTQDFLRQQGIKFWYGPPDLNPIEHMWD